MALTREQLQRLDLLLDQALELADGERAAWLRNLPAEYADLHETLSRLLGMRAGIELTLPRMTTAPPVHKPGDAIGAYELILRLGRGGMAEVWLARRADGVLKREVALKLPCGTDWRGDLEARFDREKDILAGLEHLNIARLYDAGVSLDGLPFLAVEYVDGTSITEWCSLRRSTLRERVALFLQVLEAVEYAHRHGVLHRDLKPSNVLVTGDGQVRLLDFGVAKLLLQSAEPITEEFGKALTPAYASPEQLRDEDASATSDIYSLGVLLYELLCGALPRGTAGDNPATVRTPSAAVNADAAAARQSTPARLTAQLRGDLDAVVMKALSPIPGDRYLSARAMAQDLQAYLEGRPVAALPAPAMKRLAKFARREPMACLAGAALLVVVALGGFELLRQPAATPPAPVVSEQSIAVLAFTNLSADHEQEFFSDGLAEELLDLLSRVPGLHVTARTSSFYFKGKQATVEEIGRALHVAHVLEGSVRRSGDRLRVTTELISTRTGERLWSQTYERTLDDIFKVQDEIAGSVASALKVKLAAGRRSLPYRPKDPEAHVQYLLGNQYTSRNTEGGTRQAIAAYRKAIALDPRYAAAYAQLSLAENYLADQKGDVAGSRIARDHANMAIQLDPDEPEAYLARADLLGSLDWQWSAALSDMDHALALDPENGEAYRARSLIERALGQLDEAIADAAKSTVLDPLNVNSWNDYGQVLGAAQRYPQAHTALETGYALDSRNPYLLFSMAQLELQMGRYAEAQQRCGAVDDDAFRLTCEAMAQHSLGHDAESRAALARLEQGYAKEAAYQIAAAYGWCGERDRAFQWLERSVRQRDGGLEYFASDANFRALRADPRFGEVLRQIHVVP